MSILNKENSNEILGNKEYPVLYVYKYNESLNKATLTTGSLNNSDFKNDIYNKYTISTNALANETLYYVIPNIDATKLGDESFKKDYNLKYAYYGGAMANGIASADMVIALGLCGCMGSYGCGGVSLDVIEKDIDKIKAALHKNEPYMVNMLCNRNVEAEMALAKLLIEKEVLAVEASAYITPSEPLVYYRVKGIHRAADGRIVTPHKVIAKVSREEVLTKFAMPPELTMVNALVNKGLLTRQEADLSQLIPMADDITVEADSGGHTDGRPLVSMLPALVSLKDKLMKQFNYEKPVRIGAGGGIGTGLSALAAFDMGAAYVVTGSVNQACVEAGTSDYVKQCLEETAMADVAMAPCADMFEDGAKVEVIKKKTMYAQNASKLYELYKKYPSFEAIPEAERTKVEKRILKKSFNEIWDMTKDYFSKVNPAQIDRAMVNPKLKMALVFRWYLGNSSRWAVNGDADRKMDMQIWCGQAMGAFNLWVKGTPLEKRENRHVDVVANLIMNSAATEYMRNFISKL